MAPLRWATGGHPTTAGRGLKGEFLFGFKLRRLKKRRSIQPFLNHSIVGVISIPIEVPSDSDCSVAAC